MITYLNINRVPKIHYDNIPRTFSISMEVFSIFYYLIAKQKKNAFILGVSKNTQKSTSLKHKCTNVCLGHI